VLDGTMPLLGADGVTMTEGQYRPTDVCDAGIADKLSIPAAYLRKTRDSHPAVATRCLTKAPRSQRQHTGVTQVRTGSASDRDSNAGTPG
jgi:hypothetical protein